MAITQSVCTSFKNDLITGAQNVSTDTFYLALYTSSASLGADTSAYTTSGEVVGAGYTAGGQIVTGLTINTSGSTVYIDFADLTWVAATLTARGALLYNTSRSNKAVAVFDFGTDKTVTVGSFLVTLPANTPTTALIRLT